MTKAELSIMDVLKRARHDYLNELQIILMHIDLDNGVQAKQKIISITDDMRHYSKLEKLRMPALEQWLTTFEWLYSSFHKRLICDIETSIKSVKEEELIFWLQSLFNEVENVVNPISEYNVTFTINVSKDSWSLDITVKGELPNKEITIQQNETILVEKTISHNLWTFTIRGQ